MSGKMACSFDEAVCCFFWFFFAACFRRMKVQMQRERFVSVLFDCGFCGCVLSEVILIELG